MSQQTRKVRDSQTLIGTALVSGSPPGSSLHGAEPEVSQEGRWWSSPKLGCSAHLPANGAASQITLRLSGLGIVSLSSSRGLGSASGLSHWLSCAVAVGWLPGLECLRGSHSSLGLKLAVVEPQLGMPTEHQHMASPCGLGLGTAWWLGSKRDHSMRTRWTLYHLLWPSLTSTSLHELTRFQRRTHRPSFVAILKPPQLSREKSLSYQGWLWPNEKFCGIGQTKPNHVPRAGIADYNGLYPLS